jgi:hypothetical protein
MQRPRPRPRAGDLVTYEAFGGLMRTVKVTNVDDDIKNGKPGFDGHSIGIPTDTYWGYDHQIVRIERE